MYVKGHSGTAEIQANEMLSRKQIHANEGSNFFVYPAFMSMDDLHTWSVVTAYEVENDLLFQSYAERAIGSMMPAKNEKIHHGHVRTIESSLYTKGKP